MKKLYFILLLSVLSWPTLVHAQETNNQSLTLRQCVDYALQNATNVKNAELEIGVQEAKAREVLAMGLPQINGELEGSYFYRVPKTLVPGEEFGGKPGEVLIKEFQPSHIGEAGIKMTQLLIDGSYFVGLRAARTLKTLAVKEARQSKTETVEAVTKAYYSALVARENRALLDQNLLRLDTLLYETEKLFENGFAEKLDVDRIRVSRNNTAAEKQKIDRETELSTLLLKYQMGMPISAELTLADNLDEIDFEDAAPSYPLNFNYNNRIEYSILNTQAELTNFDIRNNTFQYFPRLTAFAGFGASNGGDRFRDFLNIGRRWFNNGAVGLRLDVPIFDGFEKSNKIQQIKLNLKKIQNTQKDLENLIDFQVRQANYTYENTIKTLKTREETMELAKEVSRVAQIKYKEGVGSNLEVTEAETSLKEAQTNYFNALYDVLVAKTDREKAFGTLYTE